MMRGLISDFGSNALGVNDPEDRHALDLIDEIVMAEFDATGGLAGGGGGGGGDPFRLRNLIVPLEAFRFYQKHPYITMGAVSAIIGGMFYGFFALGASYGRQRGGGQ